MKKRVLAMIGFVLLIALSLTACKSKTVDKTDSDKAQTKETTQETPSEETDDTVQTQEPVTILVAAAASLQYSYTDELIPLFKEEYPNITVEGTYDSSGKLQTQIEEGLEADVFMSASKKQMNALTEEGLIDNESVVDLLENKIVLITGKDNKDSLTAFEDITKANTIAIGDPESVPAGQYAKEALTNLGLWDSVEERASLGTNVTEVLNWVAEGSADAGVVYATDAATTQDVAVIAQAPEGALEAPVIYPVGVATSSSKKDAAQVFVEFLQSDKALAIFEKYGFTPNK
ncbi:MAG: molybdate ABC transporter substrate-binding protein [Velocimicrobium sp.]